jgi:hypothetical protein
MPAAPRDRRLVDIEPAIPGDRVAVGEEPHREPARPAAHVEHPARGRRPAPGDETPRLTTGGGEEVRGVVKRRPAEAQVRRREHDAVVGAVVAGEPQARPSDRPSQHGAPRHRVAKDARGR